MISYLYKVIITINIVAFFNESTHKISHYLQLLDWSSSITLPNYYYFSTTHSLLLFNFPPQNHSSSSVAIQYNNPDSFTKKKLSFGCNQMQIEINQLYQKYLPDVFQKSSSKLVQESIVTIRCPIFWHSSVSGKN